MNRNRSNLVSIIIPTKNEEKNIESCLKSCLEQTYREVEIIVIDNYSKDKTTEIAKKYTKLVFQKGNERSAQRNFGAKKSHGNWLLFLDADMQPSPNVISQAVNIAKKENFDAIVIPENVKGDNFWARCLALEKSIYQNLPNVHASRFFKKEAFAKLGGFNEELIAGEDWDLHQRAKEARLKIGQVNSVINNMEENTTLIKILSKKYYYAKHIKNYAKKHPQTFISQSNFFGRFISSGSLKTMAKDPSHALGLIFLKISQAVIGIVGLFF